MASPVYTMNIVMDLKEFHHCPHCGGEVIEAAVQSNSGPECPIMVCPACQVAWPVQED